MGLRQSLSTAASNVGNLGAAAANTVNGYGSAALANIATIPGNLIGDFTGLSDQGLEELKTAIDAFCTKINNQIDAINTEADAAKGFAGPKIQEGIQQFVVACKELLVAWVNALQAEKGRVDKAFEEWTSGMSGVQSNIESAAEDVRSQAAQINLD